MKRRSLLSVVILVWLMISCRTLIPSSPDIDLEAEEYAVYSAVIAQMVGEPDQLVLREYTNLDNLGEDPSSIIEYISESIPNIDENLIRDFVDVNNGRDKLRDHFDLTSEIVFVDQEEYLQIFSEGSWDAFYERYPDSNGVVVLSRIAFDRDFQHALVYVGHSFDFLGGAGQYVYLSKVDGSWMVEETVLAWIS
jgi:hypothetical protein